MSQDSSLKVQLAQLSAQNRAELAEFLIDSLDPETDADALQQWNRELARRLDQIRTGDVQGIPLEVAMQQLRARHSE